VLVTAITILLAAVALFSGLRRRFPKCCSFLLHTRFSIYLTITLFPIQANYLKWSWDRLLAIVVFVIPTWWGLALVRRAMDAGALGKVWPVTADCISRDTAGFRCEIS
jgi:hypothetical protein